MTKFAVGIGIAVIAALIGAPTFAQLPSPTAVQPASIWSGWYAGVNGGWGWNANVQNQTIVTTSSPGLGGYPNATSGIMNPNGVFGGVTLGYNWQLANIVFGAEGDFDVASIVNHLPSRTIDVFNDQLTAEQDLNWFSTIRGRLGYAFSNLLVYGTGGWAYGRVNNYLSLTLGAAPFGIATWQDNGEKSGYTVGGGFEYMFLPRLSFKAEYQYIDLGSFTAGSAPLVGGAGALRLQLQQQLQGL